MQTTRQWAMWLAGLLLLSAYSVSARNVSEKAQRLIDELGLVESASPVQDQSFWRKPTKIHIVLPGADSAERAAQLKAVKEAVGDVEVVPVSYPIPNDEVKNMEVLLAGCSAKTIQGGSGLRWFQAYSHGVDRCMYPGIDEKSFLLTNTQHTSAPPIADHVIAMMTMLTRGLHNFYNNQRQGQWERRPFAFPVLELENKTMLVVGLGGIGIAVAKRAHGLGMNVLGVRNSSRSGPDFVEYVGLSHEVHKLAGRADVIVNALPLTDKTRGLFDEKFFDSVKRGAYFISVGRGESTVTKDLIAALNDGRLSAAGLDVTDPEPLPPDHELWTMSNVIITPHMSSTTDQGRWRRWEVILENLRRYVHGDKMLNVVDTSEGY